MTEKLFLRAFESPLPERPPFWFMRQAGRYLPEYRELRRQTPDFLRFCYTPDLAVEATLQPLRRFHPDAAILFSDILVVADALGCDVRFVEGQGPVLEPVKSATDISGLKLEGVEEHLRPVYETVRRLAREIPAETALIGFAGSPWTLAIYMVEGRGGTACETARQWAYRDPDSFGALIRLLVEATVVHLRCQIANGAEVVQLFDSWAGILSETQFRSWVIAPTAEIVRRIKHEFPNVPIIGFPRASGVLCEDYALETGVDGVAIDAGIPLEWARHALQRRCVVQGNLDNQLLVAGGEALRAETLRILGALGDGPFVFNLGHGVLPRTPAENVGLVAELVRNWRRG